MGFGPSVFYFLEPRQRDGLVCPRSRVWRSAYHPLTKSKPVSVGRAWKHCAHYHAETLACFQSAITSLMVCKKKSVASQVTVSGGLRARHARPSHRSRCPQARPTKNFIRETWHGDLALVCYSWRPSVSSRARSHGEASH
jgi:hypothetical protein